MRCFTFVLLIATASTAVAGPVADAFRAGILGLPWGADAAAIEDKYPGGKWQSAPTRFYTVADARSVLGVDRSKRDTITFSMSSDGRLRSVVVSFPKDDKTFATLLNRSAEQFGQAPPAVSSAAEHTLAHTVTASSVWPPDEGIAVSIVRAVSIAGTNLVLIVENTTIRAGGATGLE